MKNSCGGSYHNLASNPCVEAGYDDHGRASHHHGCRGHMDPYLCHGHNHRDDGRDHGRGLNHDHRGRSHDSYHVLVGDDPYILRVLGCEDDR